LLIKFKQFEGIYSGFKISIVFRKLSLKLITIFYNNNEGLLIRKNHELPHTRKLEARQF